MKTKVKVKISFFWLEWRKKYGEISLPCNLSKGHNSREVEITKAFLWSSNTSAGIHTRFITDQEILKRRNITSEKYASYNM
jgi:hypothetical protein